MNFDNLNYCSNKNNINKISNISSNIQQNNQNYFSIMNNNINNLYNSENAQNDHLISNDTKNNIFQTIINPNFNNINYNYNIMNNNNSVLNNIYYFNKNNNQINNFCNIFNPYQNNMFFPSNNKNYDQPSRNDQNNIVLNEIKYNNKDNNIFNHNNKVFQNNIMEKNNFNNKIFKTRNVRIKKNKNINNNYMNKDINSSQNITLNGFIQYIKSLPMELDNYLCTSKGIFEIKKNLPQTSLDYKKFLILYLNKNGLAKIMKNVYGNYFFQQLIKNSEEQIISLIIMYISDYFIDISKDSSGTFSLQALLDEISTLENEQKILGFIKCHEMEMAYDKNATHVLQKLILIFPDNHRKELNQIILNNIKELCLDSNGICLIKNFIKTSTLINDKKRINDEFVKHFLTLAESPFGNYGIQFLIENWDKSMLNDIKDKLLDNIYKLSMQQYSSNVVEKAIEILDGDYREKLKQKLCFEGYLITLLNNKYGRYVLYKTVNYMDNTQKNDLEKQLLNFINIKTNNNKNKNKARKFLIKIQYKWN